MASEHFEAPPSLSKSLTTDSTYSGSTLHDHRQTVGLGQRLGEFQRQLRLWWLNSPLWPFELLSWVTSLAYLGATIIVLAIYDNRIYPNWRYGITINTVVSLFITLSSLCVMVPIGTALGQIKWLWLHKGKPISDFDLIEEASRSPAGSVTLLLQRRGGALCAIGAFLSIATFAMNPLVQQLVTIEQRHLPKAEALLPTAKVYQYDRLGPAAFVAFHDMKAAIYDGALRTKPTPFLVHSSCPTGNCTWNHYESLAVCSACHNLTSQLVAGNNGLWRGAGHKLDVFSESHTLPNGFRLSMDARPSTIFNGDAVFFVNVSNIETIFFQNRGIAPGIMRNRHQYPSLESIAFKHKGTKFLDLFLVRNDGPFVKHGRPEAHECMLQFCVKSYRAKEIDGVLIEHELHSWTNDSAAAEFKLGTRLQIAPFFYLKSPNSTQSEPFAVSGQSLYDLSEIMSELFKGTGGFEIFTDSSRDPIGGRRFSNMVVESMELAQRDVEPNASISELMENVARSMTRVIRTSGLRNETRALRIHKNQDENSVAKTDKGAPLVNNQSKNSSAQATKSAARDENSALHRLLHHLHPQIWSSKDRRWDKFVDNAIGTAFAQETLVNVQWAWIVFPIAIELFGLLFTLWVMFETRRHNFENWKSNSLATLLYGPTEDLKRSLGPHDDIGNICEAADGLVVRLSKASGRWKLDPVSTTGDMNDKLDSVASSPV